MLPCENVMLPCENVMLPCENVMLPCENVMLPCENVMLPCENVMLPCENVMLPCENVMLPCENVIPCEKIDKKVMVEHLELLIEGEENDTKKANAVYSPGNRCRCRKSIDKRTYAPKRRYHPPKNVSSKKKVAVETSFTSHKKIVGINTTEASKKEELDGYRLFHLGVLERLPCGFLCPDCCNQNVCIDTDVSNRKSILYNNKMQMWLFFL